MSSDIVFMLVFLVLAIVGYCCWIKFRNKLFLWGSLLYSATFLAELVDYSINNIFQASTPVRMASHSFLQLLLPIVFFLSLVLYFKISRK
jgi:hypothetical protein